MEFFLKDHLDLLTLGIIGDSMPLISENRTIVKYGLQLFKSSRKPGIKLLVEHLFRYKDTIMTKDISINIIPILNACGRLEQGKLAVEFLTTDNFIQAEKLLNKILQINDDRRILQSTYMDTIMQIINEQCNIEADKIFIITMKEIEQGISGILATQIAHQYHRLVIILNIIGTETIGTCRSIENFNIYKIIEKCSDILIKYGGHKQAAGFTLKTEYIDEFKKRVNEIINKELSIEELIPTIEIDGELKPEEVNIELVKELAVLEPYGNLNPYPIFMLRNIKIEEFSKQSQTSKNIKFKLKLNNNFITAVGLGLGYGPEQGLMRIPKYADLVIQMQINTWQNKDYLQLFIIDLKPTV
jgi:single-stranded-DNA-specific exonuclease